MNEFAFKYKYNCKYCSTKSSLQNLHENFNNFFMNEFAFKYEYNCKYCLVFSQQKAIFKYCAYLFYFFLCRLG